MIRSHHGRTPQIAASAYIDPQSVVIGDVSIGELSSVWPCTVIRGDVNWIRIGSRTNIQDGSILHVYKDTHPLVLADMVTVGHGAILHGCTIESRVLIGMGAILLNGARIGEGSIVAAGTLVPEGTVVPPGSLFMGHPGKFRRALTPEDQASIEAYATRYVEYSETTRRKGKNRQNFRAKALSTPFVPGRNPATEEGDLSFLKTRFTGHGLGGQGFQSRVTLGRGISPVAEKGKFQAIEGVRDILPPESRLWNRVEQPRAMSSALSVLPKFVCQFSNRRNYSSRSVGQEQTSFRRRCSLLGISSTPRLDALHAFHSDVRLPVIDLKVIDLYMLHKSFLDGLATCLKKGRTSQDPRKSVRTIKDAPELLKMIESLLERYAQNPSSQLQVDDCCDCGQAIGGLLVGNPLGEPICHCGRRLRHQLFGPISRTGCRSFLETRSCTTWGRCSGEKGRKRDATASSTRLARRFSGLRTRRGLTRK